jgi:hypothetical protein
MGFIQKDSPISFAGDFCDLAHGKDTSTPSFFSAFMLSFLKKWKRGSPQILKTPKLRKVIIKTSDLTCPSNKISQFITVLLIFIRILNGSGLY